MSYSGLKSYESIKTNRFSKERMLGKGLNEFLDSVNEIIICLTELSRFKDKLEDTNTEELEKGFKERIQGVWVRQCDMQKKRLERIRVDYKNPDVVLGLTDEDIKNLKSCLNEVLDSLDSKREDLYTDSKKGEISDELFKAFTALFELLSNFFGDMLLECYAGEKGSRDSFQESPFKKFDFIYHLDYLDVTINACIESVTA